MADNITAARARRRLSQRDVAERMTALGFPWRQQIADAAENRRRRITVAEVLGLALALQTSVKALMDPVEDESLVELPSGQLIAVETVRWSVQGHNDNMVFWEGNAPRFLSPPPRPLPGRQDHPRSSRPDATDSRDGS